uniref:Uncharacterized protein n=1 Tax=Trichobilharzia regenti TaxID=157069 RepID=A0AA85JMA9_TRIRE|nr:unnamed protein product [Trichobilharzia regenti]
MSRIKTCPFTLIWILFLLLINHYTDVIHCTTSKKLFGHANLQGDYNILNEDENDLSPAFLYTKVLTADDLIEVLDELNNYVSRYDHQIVCGDLQAKDEVCKMAINQLALNYYQNALNTTQHGWRSYVWRQSHNNQLYGVMLILDPKQRGNGQNNHHNQMNKILKESTHQRDVCASLFLESGSNERLRYIRLHVGPDRSLSEYYKKIMLRQFVEESTQVYLCTEYQAAGVHKVAVFANRLSLEHFINSGFEAVECGAKLSDICGNVWFKNRCLMARTITAEDCRSQEY